MTITTRVQLHCDIGLKCTKQVVKTIEGPNAGARIRDWGTLNGWRSYGGRDSCPECWEALHSETRGPDEDTQAALDGERGG